MPPEALSGPDLDGVVADAHHLRVNSRHGIVGIMRGELPQDPIPGLDS